MDATEPLRLPASEKKRRPSRRRAAPRGKLPAILQPSIILCVSGHVLASIEDAFERQHFRLFTLNLVCKAFRNALLHHEGSVIALRPAANAQAVCRMLERNVGWRASITEMSYQVFDWAEITEDADFKVIKDRIHLQTTSVVNVLEALENLKTLSVHLPVGPPFALSRKRSSKGAWPLDIFETTSTNLLVGLSRSKILTERVQHLRICCQSHHIDDHWPEEIHDALRRRVEKAANAVSMTDPERAQHKRRVSFLHWDYHCLLFLLEACRELRSLHLCSLGIRRPHRNSGRRLRLEHLEDVAAPMSIYRDLDLPMAHSLSTYAAGCVAPIAADGQPSNGPITELMVAYLRVDGALPMPAEGLGSLQALQSMACNASRPGLSTILSPLIELEQLELGRITDGPCSDDASAIALQALKNIDALLRTPSLLPKLEAISFESSKIFSKTEHLAVLQRIAAITWHRGIHLSMTGVDSTPAAFNADQFQVECFWHLLAEQQRAEADELDNLGTLEHLSPDDLDEVTQSVIEALF